MYLQTSNDLQALDSSEEVLKVDDQVQRTNKTHGISEKQIAFGGARAIKNWWLCIL